LATDSGEPAPGSESETDHGGTSDDGNGDADRPSGADEGRDGAEDDGENGDDDGAGGPDDEDDRDDTPVCGNGVLEWGEECDLHDLGGETCHSLGHVGGPLACDDRCKLDTSQCLDGPGTGGGPPW
jgi:hypothetical protein